MNVLIGTFRNLNVDITVSDVPAGVNGEGGIRTRGTRNAYTRFPSVPLRPLGHLSGQSTLSPSSPR